MAPAKRKPNPTATPKFSANNPFAPDAWDRNRVAINIVGRLIVAAIGAAVMAAGAAANRADPNPTYTVSPWEPVLMPVAGGFLALAAAEFFMPSVITYWIMCIVPPAALFLPGGRMYLMQLDAREYQTKLAMEWERQSPEQRMAARKEKEAWEKQNKL